MRAPLFLLALAAAAAAPATAADKPAPLLTAADLDPALVLPPPPARGSAQEAAELAELRAAGAARTPADETDARADGDTHNATIFVAAIGPGFDLDRLPRTAWLMAMVRASEKDAVDRGKAEFRRARPYAVDPALHACKRNDDPLSSYPSGHSSMAYAMGETLARLLPAHAPAILARAARYAQSRVVCEQHFRSDVTAGTLLGMLVAERLRAKPEFAEAFSAAEAELAAAGLR